MASSGNPSAVRDNRLVPLITPRAAATPIRRGTSAEPPSGRLSVSTRRNPAATPHGRAAIRARDQRRAALFTPGRARRQSLREQRETPRDLLRNLSRKLAPTSTAIDSSSSPDPNADSTLSALAEGGEDDDDDEFPIERPRFSLPLDGDDDEDSELKPHRSSGLEDLDNYTAQSIELPRRAWSEGPSRLDRGSLGSVRFSDYAGPELRSDDVGIDSGFFPPPAMDDYDDDDEGDAFDRLSSEEMRRQTVGRESDFGLIEVPEGEAGNESTFFMAPVESPVRNSMGLDGIAENDLPESEDEEGPTAMSGIYDDYQNMDETMPSRVAEISVKRPKQLKKNGKKISKHGIEYSSLPQGVVKKLVTIFAKQAGVGKAKIGPDTMAAMMQASDWFFEQLGDDLAAYSKHAGRKTIDESDMITLLRRYVAVSFSSLYYRGCMILIMYSCII
ncbi:centromere kinetochore component CENP-T-domain-containing protein [Pseudomassariella vexata]|uniref:Centromere kinetochore component CENP-T-domain-containing protein n=1 Tax=Pseudomassariella vexata TaxID=1141098 RepID=A0A1Y2DMJ3_9PEZI|nr:centromere kinetochore component CENP-T-domain-containing protein [Pseudomassariella vexata]ORY60513.1 centromere kinetochore component CENP-T-domain-containing protein [Pseudomassariella vexata]